MGVKGLIHAPSRIQANSRRVVSLGFSEKTPGTDLAIAHLARLDCDVNVRTG